ncbi:hypothetical protein A6770_05465 [Nostoc minutum NIES-26]|uniref:Uncharacterized protein n=1 Tax=Nostoc minutum NIES-26 TaxID=1844469 RepID=A0A367Q723_9NOSO|nr:hypothetical protein [Dendronalium sp. ChiSLP03b]MDZ8207662.1 hypothetical protein [Dendronalium sp. ChiSLP03b]RCJ19591.1 hypothetical protein A6770_05465 [Nostoc minutum NIES-26]
MKGFNHKQNKTFSIILATACGATSLLAGTLGTSSAAVASQLIPTHDSPANSQIAANTYTCPRYAGGGLLEAYIETPNFAIYICNKRGKLFYTSTSKLNGQGIRTLPAYTEEGTGYVAKNGKYEYVVNGASLEILKNGRVLQTDPVIQYVSGYSH